MLAIKKKFGKNAIMKGTNLEGGLQQLTEIIRLVGIKHER